MAEVRGSREHFVVGSMGKRKREMEEVLLGVSVCCVLL